MTRGAAGLVLGLAALVSSAASGQDVLVREASLGWRVTHRVTNVGPGDGTDTDDAVTDEWARSGLVPGKRGLFVARERGWITVRVSLENKGAPVEGMLTLEQPRDGHAVVFDQPLSMAKGALQRFLLPVALASRKGLTLVVRDGRGRELIRQEIQAPDEVVSKSRLVVVASTGGLPFSHLVPREQGLPARDPVVAAVSPTDLPESVQEYEGVDLLVLDRLPPDTLTPRQAEAVVQYVIRGGRLFCSLDPGPATKDPVRRLLGCSAGESVEAGHLALLERATGFACRPEPPARVIPLAAGDGATIWDQDLPFVLHRQEGLGLVVAAGFSLSAGFFRTWNGAPFFVDALLAWEPGRPAVPLPGSSLGGPLPGSLAGVLKLTMHKSVPPFSAVAMLLLLYVAVILPAPWLLLRRSGHLERAWLMIPVAAAVGSVIVYQVGSTFLVREDFSHRISLAEQGPPGGRGLRHSFWGFFSVDGRPADLVMRDRTAAFPLDESSVAQGPLHAAPMGSPQVHRLATYVQDVTTFRTIEAAPFPGRGGSGLALDADWDGRRLTGTLAREGDLPLLEAWIFFQGHGASVAEGPFALPWPPPTRTAATGDRFEARTEKALFDHLRSVTDRAPRPVLLFRYAGEPWLVRPASERHLDYGVLAPRGWRAPAAKPTPEVRLVPWEPRSGKPFYPGVPQHLREYVVAVDGVPPGAKHLRLLVDVPTQLVDESRPVRTPPVFGMPGSPLATGGGPVPGGPAVGRGRGGFTWTGMGWAQRAPEPVQVLVFRHDPDRDEWVRVVAPGLGEAQVPGPTPLRKVADIRSAAEGVGTPLGGARVRVLIGTADTGWNQDLVRQSIKLDAEVVEVP